MTADRPPSVLFLHGVGMSPMLFDRVRRVLRPMDTTAPLRAGYREATHSGSLDGMVEDTASIVRGGRPTALVGVSGGATLALALACRHPTEDLARAGVQRVVVHEPLVGPLAPGLHEAIVARAAALASDEDPSSPLRFVQDLVGQDTWRRMPPAMQTFATAHAAMVRREVPLFTSFAPAAASIAEVRLPLTVTVGADSPAPRHEAAAVLARIAGAAVQVVPGGHLACWEHPEFYADTIRRCLATPWEPHP